MASNGNIKNDMKFIKTYEGLLGFLKRKEATISSTENIVRYSKEDILNILQELNDDLDFNIQINDIKVVNVSDVSKFKDFSNNFNKSINAFGHIFAKDVFSYKKLEIDYTTNINNCYEVLLKNIGNYEAAPYIRDMLDSKSEIYNFSYMISNRLDYYGDDRMEWRILIY